MHSDSPWIIVTPTYAWRIPRILQEWLEKTALSGSKEIYFVMTCGTNIGNAGMYLKKLCDFENMNYLGCSPVVMPENYIALFAAPAKEAALKIIHQAEIEIDKMNSGIVNDLFYPVFVHAKKFYVKDTCISCEKCETVCPLKNIHMKNGRPV